jgi:hypothetical protein
MPIYYISPYGDDTYNGLGKHPSAATNKPWRTLKKALESGGLAAGDTVYVAPGDYGGTITVAYSGNADNDAGRIKIYGDPQNLQGFTTDGTTPIKPGHVNILERTNRFTSITGATHLINLSGKSYYTFKNLNVVRSNFQSTTYAAFTSTAPASSYITFNSCCIISNGSCIAFNTANNAALNITISNCVIVALMTYGVALQVANSGTLSADVDLVVKIENSFISSFYSSAVRLTVPNVAYFAGGVDVNNCTLNGPGSTVMTAVNVTTAGAGKKLNLNNCLVLANGAGTAISAAYSGQIVGSSVWYAGVLSNYTKSSNDVNICGASTTTASDLPLLLEFGQSQLWGFQPKPFFTPLGLPGIGACNTDPGNLTTDLLGRPRPAGGGVRPYLGTVSSLANGTGAYTTGTVSSATATTLTVATTSWTAGAYIGKKVKILTSTASPTLVNAVRWISSNTNNTLTVTPSFDYTAVGAAGYPQANDTFEIYDPAKDIAVGCYELHDTGEPDTAIKDSGVYSMKLNGPGDQEIRLSVAAGYTTITIKGYYSSDYTGTLPKTELLANSKVGLGDFATNPVYLTKTMTAAAATWETLTFNIFPTASGYVTLRLTNQSTTGTASVYFDSLNIS